MGDLCARRTSASADRALILRDLPLHSCVAVLHHRFHFAIIPLIADCGIFSGEEFSRLDLLHRCRLMEVTGTPEFSELVGEWILLEM